MFHPPDSRSIHRPTLSQRRLHWLLLVSLLLQSIGPAALAASATFYAASTNNNANLGANPGANNNANPGANTAINGSEHPAPGASQSSNLGIWTISCTGKPMWLPFPGKNGNATDSIPNDRQNDSNVLHCLICNNLPSTDTLLPTGEHPDFERSGTTAARHTQVSAIAVGQARQPYHSRAPPFSTHD